MEKRALIVIVLILIVLALIFGFYGDIFTTMTGKAISNEVHTIGPSLEEQNCMRACTSQGCNANDMECMKNNSDACMIECNVNRTEITEETSCMEKCVIVGCGEFDFACQTQNKDKCEKECGMIKEPETKSEEEQCIRDCVNSAEPGLICQAGQGGEKGNEICQRCAKECEHLYAGPCLNEEKLEQKKRECQTCEHCYGEPIMGDSGEGYDCIVDIACKDASSEFGDNPGTGEGISAGDNQGVVEDIISGISEAVGDIVESISNFFKGLFGGETGTTQSNENQIISEQQLIR